MNTIARIRSVLRAHVALVVLGVVCVGGGVWYVVHTHQAYVPNDPAYNAVYWKEQITMRGSKAAFATFKQKHAQEAPERVHFAAHVFGAMLAEVQGVDGITACDASFGFGCYHGFFSKIISSGGESYISKLDAACVAAYGPFGTGCQHGIGHGVLEYVGYERLDKALSLCSQTTQKVPLLGCTSGVFMEYFTPLVEQGEVLAQRSRAFDQAHPHAPCDTVSGVYAQSCYFELGHWLYATQSQRATTDVGVVCATAPEVYQAYCFLGLGDTATSAQQYSAEKATAFCDAFETPQATYCRAGVSWALFANPPYRDRAAQVCALADPVQARICREYADLTLGQANQ